MTASRSPWTPSRAAGAALLVVGAIGAGAYGLPGRGPATVKYRPDSSVPRLQFETVPVPDIGRVTGFDVADGTLYVLDGLNHRVVRLERGGGGTWQPTLSFGRKGEGPSEFGMPTGIAVTAGGVITVADGNLVHHFDHDGVPLSSAPFNSGCTHYRPDVVAYREGYLVTASCWQKDTLMMVLSYVSQDGSSRRLAAAPRTTLDGRLGSYLVGGHVAVEGSRYVFGTGIDACYYEGHGSVQAPRRACGLAAELYGDRPQPSTEEFLRDRRAQSPRASRVLQWPTHFPVYKQILLAPEGVVLFREFAEDSVVLRLARSEEDLLVAGLDGLVGCRRGWCLWEHPQLMEMHITLLHASTVVRPRETRSGHE
jgi:hypothetical protein